LRGVLGDPTVRRIFAIYGVAFLASQMSRPYQALIVEGIVGPGPGLTASIGLVAGPAALVGAAVSPLGGIVGDRIGFRPVLLTALVVGGIALLAVPLAPTILALALAVVAFTAANGLVGAMVFSLLATEVPVERRSQTLNLVYLPLYAAGVVGPAVGGALAGPFGAAAPFWPRATFRATTSTHVRHSSGSSTNEPAAMTAVAPSAIASARHSRRTANQRRPTPGVTFVNSTIDHAAGQRNPSTIAAASKSEMFPPATSIAVNGKSRPATSNRGPVRIRTA